MVQVTNHDGGSFGSADSDSSHRTCSMTILEMMIMTMMSNQLEMDYSAIIFGMNLENNLIADTFLKKNHI